MFSRSQARGRHGDACTAKKTLQRRHCNEGTATKALEGRHRLSNDLREGFWRRIIPDRRSYKAKRIAVSLNHSIQSAGGWCAAGARWGSAEWNRRDSTPEPREWPAEKRNDQKRARPKTTVGPCPNHEYSKPCRTTFPAPICPRTEEEPPRSARFARFARSVDGKKRWPPGRNCLVRAWWGAAGGGEA